MDSVGDGTRWRFPTDAFVEILLRLPPNIRRRFRLVSRHWRNVIDESSLMFPHRPKTLVVTDGGSPPFVVDDRTGRRRDLWTSSTDPRLQRMRIVGTSNGLVCLCDDGVPGGAITVANPVTGETLDIPPLPLPPSCDIDDDAYRDECHPWHQAYSFGYHPTTRRYKVVHLPCRFDQDWEFPTMQAFTLGEEAWKDVEVPVPVSGCDLDAGIVNINGTAYWATVAGDLMSFDLEEERAMKVVSRPLKPGTCWFMAEVHGRLGIVFLHTLLMMDTIEVCVMPMDATHRWKRWCTVQVTPSRNPSGQRARGHQRLTRPLFVLGSDHVLTWESTSSHGGLYRHKLCKYNKSTDGGGALGINGRNNGRMVADIGSCLDTRAFAYVETRQSLSVYALAH